MPYFCMAVDIEKIANIDYYITCVKSWSKLKCMNYLISIVRYKIPSKVVAMRKVIQNMKTALTTHIFMLTINTKWKK